MQKINVLVCGAGTIGGGILKVLDSDSDYNVFALDKESKKTADIKNFLKSTKFIFSAEAVKHNFEVILLAVKPQDFETLFFQIKDLDVQTSEVITVMTGISTATISAKFHSAKKIIRVMPNIGIHVNDSVTVCYNLRKTDLSYNIIKKIGKSVLTEDEGLLNAATVISGAGPGFLYFFLENLESAAIEFGFLKDDAKTMVLDSAIAALQVAKLRGNSFDELYKAVASKKGVTEAGVDSMKEQGVQELLLKSFYKALSRAVELGK